MSKWRKGIAITLPWVFLGQQVLQPVREKYKGNVNSVRILQEETPIKKPRIITRILYYYNTRSNMHDGVTISYTFKKYFQEKNNRKRWQTTPQLPKYLWKYCSREVNAKCFFTSYSHYLFPLPKASSDQKNPNNKKQRQQKCERKFKPPTLKNDSQQFYYMGCSKTRSYIRHRQLLSASDHHRKTI